MTIKDKYDRKQRAKTRKGAIHNHRPTFKSFNVWIAFPTPAIYRRQHAGRQA